MVERGEDWRRKANCRDSQLDDLFPVDRRSAEVFYAEAVQVCEGCPVVAECLALVDSFEPDDPKVATGVFGGMSPEQRVARRRKMKRKSRAQA